MKLTRKDAEIARDAVKAQKMDVMTYFEITKIEVPDSDPNCGKRKNELMSKCGMALIGPPTGKMWVRYHPISKEVARKFKKKCVKCGLRANWQIGQHRSNGEMDAWYFCEVHKQVKEEEYARR